MIRRIKIEGFKSLRSVEVHLQPLSVLFGPNAAGKSNLLDALLLLARIVQSKTLSDAFLPPFRGKPLEAFTFPKGGLEELLKHESATFSIEVDVALSETTIQATEKAIEELSAGSSRQTQKPHISEPDLRYRLTVEIRPRSGVLRIADEELCALTKDGEPTRKRNPFLSREGDRLHLRMERQAHPRYYERYLDHSVLSLPHYAPHHPHLAAFKRELENWRFFYFEPREQMRAPTPVQETHEIGLTGNALAAFLYTLRAENPKQFDALVRALRGIVPFVDNIEVRVNKYGEVELDIGEGERRISARTMSEGTLRVLGLLALGSMSPPPTLIGFEEPENGVHPARIRLLGEMLHSRTRRGNTQMIVTTHSPTLLDHVEPSSLFVCTRGEDGATSIRPLRETPERDQFLQKEIASILDPSSELRVSDLILRGAFDA